MNTKNNVFAILIAFCLSCVFTTAMANNYEAKRTITKSFEATKGYTLLVEHKYGNINVQTWSKNEVYFEIKMIITSSTQKKADELLSNIDVKFEQMGKQIKAQTVFQNNLQCNNCGMTLEYSIMVPKGMDYIFDNKYGNILLGDADGNTDITVKYGNLFVKNFLGDNNIINVKYGNFECENSINNHANNIDVKYGSVKINKLTGNKNVLNIGYAGNIEIKETNDLEIDVKYSKLNIGTANELKIESGYTNTSITKVKKLNLSSKYENYNIGEIDELNAEYAYTNVSIGKLNKVLKISEIKYGKLNIDDVLPTFELINVDASYTNVKIRFDPKASYNVDLYTKYSTIEVPSGSKTNRTEPDKNSIQVKGIVGNNSSPKANVNITNKYNGIYLK